MYQEEVARFAEAPENATAYLSVGKYQPNQELDVVQLASLATVANAIMNTDEAYTKR